jgi:hypothetical protein
MAEENHYMTMLEGALPPIYVELLERLDADLSEKDRVAVMTAFTKVAFGATRIAVAEAAAQLIGTGAEWTPRFDLVETDAWADRYGGEA